VAGKKQSRILGVVRKGRENEIVSYAAMYIHICKQCTQFVIPTWKGTVKSLGEADRGHG